MSFGDLASRPGDSRSFSKPQLSRGGDQSIEQNIKAGIQRLLDSIRTAEDTLWRFRYGSSSTETILDVDLQRCHEVQREVERLLREWTVQMAGEPLERHRRKVAQEKLRGALNEALAQLTTLEGRVETARRERASTSTCDDAGIEMNVFERIRSDSEEDCLLSGKPSMERQPELKSHHVSISRVLSDVAAVGVKHTQQAARTVVEVAGTGSLETFFEFAKQPLVRERCGYLCAVVALLFLLRTLWLVNTKP